MQSELSITLQKYLKAFAKLKRGGTRYGVAPHKPILLLSLLELVEKDLVPHNHFYVTPELVGTFLENWRLLVTTPHQADFTQPFYYLQSDKVEGQPFWQLMPQPGYTISAHIKSVNTLKEALDYGTLREDLFALALDQTNRITLQIFLLEQFFPDRKDFFLAHKQMDDGFLLQVEGYVLNEPEAKLKKLQIQTEEEVFVRSGLFKRYVLNLYQETCAFTEMKLTSTYGHSFVDACHIVPFSVSHDDKIANGIALCPNMHRAFDRGLISINSDYRIIVSKHIREDENHGYSLSQLKEKPLLLPKNNQYWPKPENLNWHREHIFKN